MADKILLGLLRLLVSLCLAQALNPPLANFTQRVHHNSNNTATFQQQYQLSSRYFKPGGPILLVQGDESTIFPLEDNTFSDYEVELGGIGAAIEHRYFGNSFPDGYQNTTEYFSALTLENVLLDSVEFVRWIKTNVTGAENSPVFITGGMC
jgi:hypothetical protein